MINIGRLGTDIDATVNYYIQDEPSTPSSHDRPQELSKQPEFTNKSVASYYLGKAHDGHGRWVGSLCSDLGVSGAVETEAFRRLLQRCHPVTGEPITPGAAHAQRKTLDAKRRPHLPTADGATVNVSTAAAYLRLSPQYVRRLAERAQAGVDEFDSEDSWAYLRATKS